ncbi:MAG TPA: glycosyltransferase family A protein [Saprospiraceae bacterium]|nr:glycosyltransferase family A protein [Saprospiraceae bacterium]
MVTIIIPYINEFHFLEEALESAYRQQIEDVEIIAVCNDRLFKPQLTSLPGMYPNTIWLHEPIPGSAFARNKGLHSASGDWIQFLDVDDLLFSDKIQNQMKYATNGAVVSPHIYKHFNGVTEFSKWKPSDIWSGIIGSSIGSTSSMLWNRKALVEVNGWNSNYQSNQEYELLFRLAAKNYEVIPANHHETIVREREMGSITKSTKHFRAEQGIMLREDIWQYLVSNQMDTPERLEVLKQYLFKQLRATYRRDSASTMEIFKKYYQNQKFSPNETGIPFYKWIYSFLGFRKTESLFKFYSLLRDKYLPFLPLNK